MLAILFIFSNLFCKNWSYSWTITKHTTYPPWKKSMMGFFWACDVGLNTSSWKLLPNIFWKCVLFWCNWSYPLPVYRSWMFYSVFWIILLALRAEVKTINELICTYIVGREKQYMNTEKFMPVRVRRKTHALLCNRTGTHRPCCMSSIFNFINFIEG
jgi:hypothetical protein